MPKGGIGMIGVAFLAAIFSQPVSAALYFYNINLAVPDAMSGHAGELLNTQKITNSYYIAVITVHLTLRGSSALQPCY